MPLAQLMPGRPCDPREADPLHSEKDVADSREAQLGRNLSSSNEAVASHARAAAVYDLRPGAARTRALAGAGTRHSRPPFTPSRRTNGNGYRYAYFREQGRDALSYGASRVMPVLRCAHHCRRVFEQGEAPLFGTILTTLVCATKSRNNWARDVRNGFTVLVKETLMTVVPSGGLCSSGNSLSP